MTPSRLQRCDIAVPRAQRICGLAQTGVNHFGLRALKLHEPLMRAARGHSNDMEQRRFFDHMSPVPGKRSPGDRCKAEGASYAGENIAMGMNTGRGAFNAWYTSSGHHRNMLMKGHVSIGIGNSQSGRYWTQNFGYDNPK